MNSLEIENCTSHCQKKSILVYFVSVLKYRNQLVFCFVWNHYDLALK